MKPTLTLKDVFRKFCENTTAHAPPKVITHKYMIAKVFWLILFFVGIGTCIFFFHRLITGYLSYKTTTNIELQFSVLEFPAVTICNQNRFHKDKIEPDIQRLMGEFLTAKRADMFGGREKLTKYEMGIAAGISAAGISAGGFTGSTGAALPETTTASLPKAPSNSTLTTNSTQSNFTQASQSGGSFQPGNLTTTTPTGPTTTPQTKQRRKRAVSQLNEEEQLIMNDMARIYKPAEIPGSAELSWFANDGGTSADKEILLNLTSYLYSVYNTSQLSAMGHTIDELLQECVFVGKICGPKDFYQFYDNKYGNCFTFNSGLNGNITRITNPGSSFGLTMTLFINQDMYLPVLTPEAGVRMMLHKQGQVPLLEEEGFDVMPGTKTGVAVRYVEVHRQSGLFGDCIDKGTNSTLYPGNYTQKSCLKTCLQYKLIEKCGCANPLYRKPDEYNYCSSEEYPCIEEYEDELLTKEVCKDACPLPCYESQYQYIISSSQWPSNAYMPYLAESLKARGEGFNTLLKTSQRTGLGQHFLKVQVYYDNLNYYNYVEVPTMLFEDLVGALGGHLGLWIGMSVLSFLEVFELLVSIGHYFIYKFTQNNKTESMTDLDGTEQKVTMTPVKTFNDKTL